MSDVKSLISSSVDFNENGIQHGFLKLPYSRDDSAWGAIMIPITVIRNGDGPTALLTGANHGDEYEGPVALYKLGLSLKPEEIQGRVIIVPFMNYPAFMSATRTSPIDKGNMNRTFPGRYNGTVTEKIAHYIYTELLPMADFVLDYHSGGKTLDFIPFAAAHVLNDKHQQQRCVDAMHAFAAPYHMMMLEIDNVGMYDTAVEDMGKVFVTTELGGGGSATAKTIEIAQTGAHNFLVHAGIKNGELIERDSLALDMPDDRCFTTSKSDGLLEMCVDLGDKVHKGQEIARVYSASHTGLEPAIYHANMDGLLVSRHFPGLIKTGDCVAVVAVIV